MLSPELAIGTEIPPLHLPPITHEALHAYADASGDHAAIHLDSETACSMGFPDVIAHGLLVMAYLGRVVTDYVGRRRLQAFSARFTSTVDLGDVLTCKGVVKEHRVSEDGGRSAELELTVVNEKGDIKIKGLATVAL